MNDPRPIIVDPLKHYAYPRAYFADSVGRPFSDARWQDFIIAMDKYALFYMNNLEKVLDKENA